MERETKSDQGREFDRIADLFEEQWSVEASGDLKSWLEKVPPENRGELLKLLAEVDIEIRQKKQLPVSPENYRIDGHFPETLFPESVATESIGLSTVRHDSGEDKADRADNRPTGELPSNINNYEILKLIGRGGMGEVYLAKHSKFQNRRYAIKLIKSSLVDDQLLERFEKEIEITGSLEHPNIVHAVDAGQVDGRPYLTMEYVDGQNLQSIINRMDRASIPESCEMIRLAATGLHHAYEQGFIHRDIKPANIMLSCEGVIKVMDMGLAKLHAQGNASGLTARGQFLGTPDFMAPEQWSESSSVSTQADIYGLGCTLFNLLGGIPPYATKDRDTISSKMYAHLTLKVPDVRQLNPEVPKGLSDIVRRSMAKDPKDRFADPRQFADALKEYCAGADLSQFSSLESPPSKQTSGERNAKDPNARTSASNKVFGNNAMLALALGVLMILTPVTYFSLIAPSYQKQNSTKSTDNAETAENDPAKSRPEAVEPQAVPWVGFQRYVGNEKTPYGIFQMMSCSPGGQSYEDPELENGVFTHFLTQGLNGSADQNKDGRITISEIAEFTTDNTKQFVQKKFESTQTPWSRLEGENAVLEYAVGKTQNAGGPSFLKVDTAKSNERSANSAKPNLASKPSVDDPLSDFQETNLASKITDTDQASEFGASMLTRRPSSNDTFALLIGIDDYENASNLRYASKDMDRIKSYLVSNQLPQSNVFLMSSDNQNERQKPTLANINRQLENLFMLTKPNDLVMVFFSGHGVRKGTTNYICPSDAVVEKTETMIPLEDFYTKLKNSDASLKLFVIDAAFNELDF